MVLESGVKVKWIRIVVTSIFERFHCTCTKRSLARLYTLPTRAPERELPLNEVSIIQLCCQNSLRPCVAMSWSTTGKLMATVVAQFSRTTTFFNFGATLLSVWYILARLTSIVLISLSFGYVAGESLCQISCKYFIVGQLIKCDSDGA